VSIYPLNDSFQNSSSSLRFARPYVVAMHIASSVPCSVSSLVNSRYIKSWTRVTMSRMRRSSFTQSVSLHQCARQPAVRRLQERNTIDEHENRTENKHPAGSTENRRTPIFMHQCAAQPHGHLTPNRCTLSSTRRFPTGGAAMSP